MPSENRKDNSLKVFFIKLISVTIAFIVIINVTYNLILGDKLEKINSILNLNKKENREQLKNKLRNEIKKGLEKDRILNKEDKDLINRLIAFPGQQTVP